MSVQSRIARWRIVRAFCARRIGDYGELFALELADAKRRMMHEVIAMVALAIGALFTLSFVSIAVIVTAVGAPYLVLTAWSVAGTWLAVGVIATIVMVTRKPTEPFQVIRDQFQRCRSRSRGVAMSGMHMDKETELLARMAETRTALLAAPVPGLPARRFIPPKPAKSGPWFLQSPTAELIALTMVALVVLGVRRTVQGVVTAGVSAWMRRALAGR